MFFMLSNYCIMCGTYRLSRCCYDLGLSGFGRYHPSGVITGPRLTPIRADDRAEIKTTVIFVSQDRRSTVFLYLDCEERNTVDRRPWLAKINSCVILYPSASCSDVDQQRWDWFVPPLFHKKNPVTWIICLWPCNIFHLRIFNLLIVESN